MNIPDKIQIGGITWEIRLHKDTIKDDATLKIGDDVTTEKTGSIDFRNAIIHIKVDLNKQIVNIGFLHEIQHAIDFTMGLNDGTRVTINEVYTDARAQLWTQVIKQILEA